MLATRWPRPFDNPAWWFEVKWDGFRFVASSEGVYSRNGKDLSGRFPDVAHWEIPPGVVLDGELIAPDDKGHASFARLQAAMGVRNAGLRGVVFDVLRWEGENVIDLTLEARWELLDGMELPAYLVRSVPIPESGLEVWKGVQRDGLEGMVAKKSGSRYKPGRRSPDWRKIVHRRTARVVVGGYLPGTGNRATTLGSVLVGAHTPEGLRWMGAVGSGFSSTDLDAFRDALGQMERATSPFFDESGIPREAVWVEPTLVIRVEYATITTDERLRAPVYDSIDQVDPTEVTVESEFGSYT